MNRKATAKATMMATVELWPRSFEAPLVGIVGTVGEGQVPLVWELGYLNGKVSVKVSAVKYKTSRTSSNSP